MKLTLVMSALIFTSCSNPLASRLDGSITSTADQWPGAKISVCWQQKEVFPATKKAMERAVVSEYRKANLKFVGWKTCQITDKGLRLLFDQSINYSYVDGFGAKATKLVIGTNRLCQNGAVDYISSNCLINTALHEFGHAVGLHHEMNRTDSFDCTERQPLEIGAINIGDYDSLSIMNYCRTQQAAAQNQRLSLSSGDLRTLRSIYFDVVAYLDFQSSTIIDRPGSSDGLLKPFGIFLSDFNARVFRAKKELGHYRFKLQPMATSCLDAGVPWGPWLEGQVALIPSLLWPQGNPSVGSTFRLCLEAGALKDRKSYTSFDFEILTRDGGGSEPGS